MTALAASASVLSHNSLSSSLAIQKV